MPGPGMQISSIGTTMRICIPALITSRQSSAGPEQRSRSMKDAIRPLYRLTQRIHYAGDRVRFAVMGTTESRPTIAQFFQRTLHDSYQNHAKTILKNSRASSGLFDLDNQILSRAALPIFLKITFQRIFARASLNNTIDIPGSRALHLHLEVCKSWPRIYMIDRLDSVKGWGRNVPPANRLKRSRSHGNGKNMYIDAFGKDDAFEVTIFGIELKYPRIDMHREGVAFRGILLSQYTLTSYGDGLSIFR